MKHRRITKRRTAIAGAAAAAVVGAAFTLQSATATPAPPRAADLLSAPAAAKLASSVTSDLRGDTAGAYYDTEARKLVVNVVDKAAADKVREKGAVAKVVQHTLAELKEARTTLSDKATIPGTSWSVDPRKNKIVVTADRTVKGGKLRKLDTVLDSLGSKVALQRTSGEYRPFVAGGDAITSGGGRCSLGFNVTVGGEPAFITAGHCGKKGSEWSADGAAIGAMEDSQFPGNDFALVKYSGDAEHPSAVNLYNGSTQKITKAAEATVGQKVKRSGSTTQVHGGEVTGLNETVNYSEGTVEGLIKTNVCAEPGDSGGALFAGSSAVGLTSGGSGDCSAGGTTFFQPVPEALEEFGAEIG
ncbi:S1 family peptidase [Streptomyces sp. NPDC002055]|uniref:S1 family peptidase n=1 Tax=Streptomyces sp. NPDC002055 TaxID=3154534 RepID=UPI00332BB8E7